MDPAQFIEYKDFEEHARASLSKMVYDYVASGAGSEWTLRENERAYYRWCFRKRILADVSEIDLRTRVLGQELAFPIMIAPTAFHRMAHPDGELATARATANLGTLMVLSTLSTQPIEAVAAAGGEKYQGWFQLYIHKSRSLTEELATRAEAAGFQALVLTVDTPFFAIRYADQRNGFTLPPGCEMANLRANLPEIPGRSGLAVYADTQMDSSLTWEDVAWLGSLTNLPLVLKGITTVADAKRAVAAGASAIIVSNHGGRQLDGDIASLDALSVVVEAVDDACPVLVDGGIRHGADVLKALALGAKAVLVGRPVWWGLAAGGEEGVCRILEILRDGLADAMGLSGVAQIADVGRQLVMSIPVGGDHH